MTGSSCRQCNAAQTLKVSGIYETPWAVLCQTHKRYAQFLNANIETVKTTGAGLNRLIAHLPFSVLGLHGFIQDFDKTGLQVRVLATGATVHVLSVPIVC